MLSQKWFHHEGVSAIKLGCCRAAGKGGKKVQVPGRVVGDDTKVACWGEIHA